MYFSKCITKCFHANKPLLILKISQSKEKCKTLTFKDRRNNAIGRFRTNNLKETRQSLNSFLSYLKTLLKINNLCKNVIEQLCKRVITSSSACIKFFADPHLRLYSMFIPNPTMS